MYYNDYEDYMRNVLGYSNANQNTYDNCNCGMNYESFVNNRTNLNPNIEQMYPEIYKVINPMVCKMCDNNTQPISEYLIEQMTDDIYDNVVNRVEIQNVINVNIGTREISEDEVSETSRTEKLSNKLQSKNEPKKIAEERETRSPQPRRRNTLLRDLIRILILNRLIRPNRPQRPPHRLPFRPGQGGPGGPIGPGFPYPGMPGRPGHYQTMPRVGYDYDCNCNCDCDCDLSNYNPYM